MRYETLLERTVEEWDDGRGIVQVVSPESGGTRLRFAYYSGGDFVNRPLTLSPSGETADRTAEAVQRLSTIACTFTAEEIAALVEELGEKRVLELSVLVEELGRGRLAEILAD